MICINRRRASCIIISLGLASTGVARADTYHWSGGSSNWTNPSNWTPNAVPDTLQGDIDQGAQVYVTDTDGVSRTIAYDETYDFTATRYFNGQHLAFLSLDLTGGDGTGVNTVTMSSAIDEIWVDGYEYVGDSANGTFTQSGGNATAGLYTGQGLVLGHDAGSNGTYNLSGGFLTAGDTSNYEIVGSSGTGAFNLSGGENTVSSHLYIGYGSSGVGTYSISGGELLTALDGGGPSPNEYVGYSGNGTISQSNGTNTYGSNLFIGYNAGSVGTYKLTGGILASTHITNYATFQYIGYEGTGTFDQSGGSNTSDGPTFIGCLAGSSGQYSLTTGTFTVNPGLFNTAPGNLFVGGSSTAAGGAGVMSVSGGSLLVSGKIKVWNTAGTVLQLSDGGSIRAASIDLSGNSSLLSWTGGTLKIEGTGADFAGSLTVPKSGMLGGDGVITDPVFVADGGAIAPGDSPGILTVGSVTLSKGSSFLEELKGTAAGTSYDQLKVTGGVDLGSASLKLTLGYSPQVGNVFTIINNSTAAPVVGIFGGLPDGALLTALNPSGGTDLFSVS